MEKDILPELKELALNSDYELAQIHALHALEGLHALDFDFLVKVSKESSAEVTSHALVLSEQFASNENSSKAEILFKVLIAKNDLMLDLYLVGVMGKWRVIDTEKFSGPMIDVLKKHKGNLIFGESFLSGLEGQENSLLENLNFMSSFASHEPNFMFQLREIVEKKKTETVNPIFSRKFLKEDNRTVGGKMYLQICASCHGANGEGIDGLAPPLMKSEHVADAQRLGLIILHGLQGPVAVNGKQYEFNLAMPGLIRNETISDKDIADIIAYATNAFSDMPRFVKKERVSELRALIPRSGAEYTEEELKEFSKKNGPPPPGFKLF